MMMLEDDLTMGVLECVMCCILAAMTLAVFRKELLKVKDVFLLFWMPKKHKKDSQTNKREEYSKPSSASSQANGIVIDSKSSPKNTVENIKKEIISHSEVTTKVTREKEGQTVQSSKSLPDAVSFPTENAERFLSETEHKHNERRQTDVLQSKTTGAPTDCSTSFRVEETTADDGSVTKTATETKHEKTENSEMTFMKTEQETVSKSVANSISPPKLNLDSLDLNELINKTQKTIESFTNGYKANSEGFNTNAYEIRKTETSQFTSETKSTDNATSALFDAPYPFNFEKDVHFQKDSDKKMLPKLRPFSDPLVSSFADCLKEMGLDTNSQVPEYQINSTESSTVTTEDPFSLTSITKKKKMFSSSSFYEEPDALYPTVEEQVEMARKIADSLADDTNRKSKGANMFYKRVKRSSKWIHEGCEGEEEDSVVPVAHELPNVEPPTPDPSKVPFRPGKGPPQLKLVLDQRHPMDLTALRSSGLVISEHNVVSPEVCHGIVKDLQSPVGKGAALFAKRKKKSEEWVVDEERVKTLLRDQERKVPTPQPSFGHFPNFTPLPDVRLVQSPWEAAMACPLGLPDAAFAPRIDPDTLADTVIRAADSKRRLFSPPPADVYSAKPPRGWATPDDNYNSYSTPPPLASTRYPTESISNKKMVFQNFNSLPRLWKGQNR